MMTVDQQFTALTEKLQALLRQHGVLQRDADKLRKELAEARAAEQTAKDRADELLQQVAVLKMAAGDMRDKDRKVFERRLTQYIKDIDRTIAFLSQ